MSSSTLVSDRTIGVSVILDYNHVIGTLETLMVKDLISKQIIPLYDQQVWSKLCKTSFLPSIIVNVLVRLFWMQFLQYKLKRTSFTTLSFTYFSSS